MSAILIRNIDRDEEFTVFCCYFITELPVVNLKNILNIIIIITTTIIGKTDLFDPQPSLDNSARFVLN
jgi:hypothetical protein